MQFILPYVILFYGIKSFYYYNSVKQLLLLFYSTDEEIKAHIS